MARKSYSDKEREQVKEALLITVLESIVNQGLVHSSIAILCEKVGISKTFFYSFFSSKEELVMQALRYQQPKLLRYKEFHPLAKWEAFIADPGKYLNGMIEGEFEE